MATAKADGFGSASLIVDADSPTGAVGIYERLGFSVTHTSVAQRKQLDIRN
jgi:mycothiol synthase